MESCPYEHLTLIKNDAKLMYFSFLERCSLCQGITVKKRLDDIIPPGGYLQYLIKYDK